MNQFELGNKENNEVKEVKEEDFVQKHHLDLFDQLIQQDDSFEPLASLKGLKEVVLTGEDLDFLKNPEIE